MLLSPTEEKLTLTLKNGKSVEIKVTDEGEDTRIALTITADSASKIYDGTPLTIASYTWSGELKEGDEIKSVDFTGEQTEPGSLDNIPSNAKIVNAEGADVTADYNITYVNGRLTVWSGSVIAIELTDFNGDIATYTVTVNPDGASYNNGDPLTVKASFSGDDDPAYASQSVDYASIVAEAENHEAITFDYSGNTGTFKIPDGTEVTITYNTRVKGDAGDTVEFFSEALFGWTENETFIAGPSARVTEEKTISPTGTDISGTGGVYTIKLFAYAQNHMEEGLGGATFRLLDSNMRLMEYGAGEKAGQPITFTTESNGYVTITLNEETDGLSIRKNTVYYLEMVTAPYQFDEEIGQYIYYQKDNTFYSFLITDDPSYNYGEIYSYFNGDVLKVRCYPEAKGVNVTKRFSGSYVLTDEQKNAIRFILQKEDLDTETGWVDVEEHTYGEFSYGSMNFNTGKSGGPELEDNATYRVIEENVLPEELKGIIDETVSVSVTYQRGGKPVEEKTNEFFVDPDDKYAYSYNLAFTNEYIDHKLTIIKIDGNSGAVLEGAQFSVYAAADASPVFTYTTGSDGGLTIRKGDEGANYDTDTLYYVVETVAPEHYILPENPEKTYFYFSKELKNPEGLPSGATAIDLTTSYTTLTVPNNSDTLDIPVTVVWGIKGDEPWPDAVDHVVVGLYKSVDGGEAVPVEDEHGQARTITLTKDAYYDNASFKSFPAQESGKIITYSVVEEGVFDGDNTDITNQFARTSSISGTGWYVVNNQAAVSVKVQKEWYDLDGNLITDTSGKPEVSFALYRTTTKSDKDSLSRAELLALLGEAEPVRTGLILTRGSWCITVESLEKTDKQGNTYYYYTLEDIPDNQEDSYTVEAATETEPRTLTIKNKQTPITVTIRTDDLTKIYGDDDPSYIFDASIMDEHLTVAVSGPDEAENYTATIKDKASGSTVTTLTFKTSREPGKDVGTYVITPAGDALQNGYRVLFETGTLTITQALVTITAGAEKVYGDDDPAFVTIEGLKYGEQAADVLVFSVSREEGEDAGNYPITLSGDEDQKNYKVTYVSGDAYKFVITRAPATVKAEDASKLYGDDDPEFAATVTGLKNKDPKTVILDEISMTRTEGENVGTYTITPVGEKTIGNYNVSYETGTLEIKVAPLEIKVEESEKTYGEGDPEWDVTFDGLQFGEDSGTLTSVIDEETGVRTYTYTVKKGETETTLLTFTVSREEGENVGRYKVTPTSEDTVQGNYILSFVTGMLEIIRAELTVKAKDQVKAVGAEDPLLEADISGWQNGDDTCTATSSKSGDENPTITWTYTRGTGEGAVTVLTFTLKRAPGETEDDYPVTAQGKDEQSNYEITYEEGTFSILSVLDIDVTQPLVDYAKEETDPSPSYSYTATLDLTGTGLPDYNKEGFEPVEGVPTLSFVLPDTESGTDMRTLKVPAGAKLTIVQNTVNSDYTTAISVDGTPYTTEAPTTYVLEHVDTMHEVAFTHSRISIMVEGWASDGQTEEEAKPMEADRKGAIGIPDSARQIDAKFADAMHIKIGYKLPSEKYYVYDHASLYTSDGTAVPGATGVTAVRYVEAPVSGEGSVEGEGNTTAKRYLWQYRIGDDEFADVPDGAKLVLFYLPMYVCKIGDVKFYTLKNAIDSLGGSGTADIEMLIPEYSIRSSDDAAIIPAGCRITIKTAETGYEGEAGTKASISRSLGYTNGSLFTNNGNLTLDTVIIDGKDISASAAMINNAKADAELTVGTDAVLQNANGADGGAIYVENGTVTVNGTLTDNNGNNGSAVYVSKGTVTFGADSNISANRAANGGAVYAAGGKVYFNDGSGVTSNSATNGGVVFMSGDAEVTVAGTIGGENTESANNAENGGAVYMTGGKLTVSVSGSMTGNSATVDGGAVYMAGGMSTVSGSMTGNSATAGNGGAVYMTGGIFDIAEGAMIGGSTEGSGNSATSGGAVYLTGGVLNSVGTLTGNTASASGGAIYGAGGAIKIMGGMLSENTATVNGGAICTDSASVSVTGGKIVNNTASSGNGGAVCADSGAVTVSASEEGTVPDISGNKAANGNGGAIYSERGHVICSSESITRNSAVNGAAIFVGSGAADISAAITGNNPSNGGAIGVGSTSAKLNFAGNAKVTDNKLGSEQRNIYLDVDSEGVINVNTNTLAKNRIGVYVPGDVNSEQVVKHGDVGGYFGAYVDSTNVTNCFKNDRFPELEARVENNRIFWGAKLVFDVVYKKAFSNTEPPQANADYSATSGNGYMKVVTAKSTYPKGAEHNVYEIYDLVDGLNLYNTYKSDFDSRAGSALAGAASVYAYTYANSRENTFDNGLQFSDYLKSIRWDNEARKWKALKSDGETEVVISGSKNRIVIIYSSPAYLYVSNNNTQGLPLELNLTVDGRDTANSHFGYATAKNGATVESLKPLVPEDLVLEAGHSVKLLFPGSAGKNYTLSGTFVGAEESDSFSYTINGGDSQTTGPNVSISDALFPQNNYSTEEIVFGDELPICKIGSVTFPHLKNAVDYMREQSGTKFTIEMLVDYLIPSTDVLNIPSGYQVTFTTATEGFMGANQGDPENGIPPRAILSRDFGNNGSSVVLDGADGSNSSLTVTNLIFDGRAIAGTGNGGAISTRRCTVSIDGCEFKGYRATRGGALFFVRGTSEVKNSDFTNCQTNANADKAGGGAIWSTSKEISVDNCYFRDCACTNKSSNAQAGAVFHNIVDNKTFNFKEFDYDTSNAYYEAGYSKNTKTTIASCNFYNCYSAGGSGGTVESDALDITVKGCYFENSYSNKSGGNGGALNVYAQDKAEPTVDCYVTVEDCTFKDCRANNNGNGGAIRSTSLYLTVRGCKFTNMEATTGGAVAMTNKNSKSLVIEGCSFNNCQATKNGGAVSTLANNVIVRDRDSDHTITMFIKCTGKNGGALYHSNTNGNMTPESMTVENASFDTCEARGTDSGDAGGGAIYTNAYRLDITGEATIIKDCTAYKEGGGIIQNQYAGTSSFSFDGGTFESCTALGNNGGAIYTKAKTVKLNNGTVSGSTVKAQGGGIWISPTTASITGCTITGNSVTNSDSKGGGVYVGGGTIVCNSTVIECSAAYGGGVYLNDGTIYILGGAISGNAVDGGGVYENKGTVNHYGGTVAGTATANGGAVYKNNGTYTIIDETYEGTSYTGASVGGLVTYTVMEGGFDAKKTITSSAVNGGGLYNVAGKLSLNAGGSIGSTATDEEGKPVYTATASANGGGVYVAGGSFYINGGAVTNCEADVNGGGVYFASSGNNNDFYFYGDNNAKIQNCRAANGGGVWLNSNTFHMGENNKTSLGTIENCVATENGGGVYVAGGIFNHRNTSVITGCEALSNGGGVYAAGGTFNLINGNLTKNTAAVNGGGVYAAGATFKLSGGVIGGSADDANIAAKGAGLYVADNQSVSISGGKITYNTEGGGIAVGSEAVLNFQGSPEVRYNTMLSGGKGVDCNIYLDQNSNSIIKTTSTGLSAGAYIGVYASDAQDEGHGLAGKPFGTWGKDSNHNFFHNDRRHYLYGVKGEGTLICWANFVCKITDGEGNLLYKDADGTPAVYTELENRANSKNNTAGAFTVLNVPGTPVLYQRNEDGTYTQYNADGTGEYQVQMLVPNYTMGSTRQIKLDAAAARKVTLTTASTTEDECGFKYTGDSRFSATITRTADTSCMIFVGGTSAWELTLRNITLDGGEKTASEEGAILRIANNGAAILDSGATLQNANTSSTMAGGAVYLKDTGASFTMKAGSQIKDCSAGTSGGAVAVNNGAFNMEGGEITGCSAQNGGGVWLTNSGAMYMKGGTIGGTGEGKANTATSNGGGIALVNTNARVYFSGNCNVTGNTLLNGGNSVRCNVQLNVDSNAIINANRIDSRSEIGVYVPDTSGLYDKHGVSSKPFGTWEVQDDNLFCFINDRSTNLRGFQSANTSDTKIYWEYHPLLTVSKAMESDWEYDSKDVEFTFKVTLTKEGLVFSNIPVKYGDMTFKRGDKSSVGVATVKLKAGQSATAILPDDFDKAKYEVFEDLSAAQKEDYTSTALKDGKAYPFAEDKPLTVIGTLGENIGTESSTSLSDVAFTNTRVIGDLTVTKAVVSSEETDKDESFDFELTLGDTSITKTYTTTKKDGAGTETAGELSFTEGKATFALKHGQSLTIHGLSIDLPYSVKEILTNEQKPKVRTQVQKDGGEPVAPEDRSKPEVKGKIAEKPRTVTVEGEEKPVYLSEAGFINNFLEIVCKITSRNRALLYYVDANKKLQPAIYSHLEDAFDQVNSGNLKTASGGTVTGALRIEMVVPEYAMERTATLNANKTIILSTALYTDEEYPYNKGEDDGKGISTVSRGFSGGSMIKDMGTLTVDKIILDGASEAEALLEASENGGVIQVANAVTLTVNNAATLRNSKTSGNGGAIYLQSGATLNMNGTIENCSAANGGGVHADARFNRITTTGTISDCEASTGDGGAICALNGTAVNLNAGTVLSGNTAASNGGAIRSDTNLILRGTVGGTEDGEGNTAGGEGGGVYMGSDAMFTMYAGSRITGNKAKNGGGLSTRFTSRLSGGTLSENAAEKKEDEGGLGGAVYAAENAVVTISGTTAFSGNQAAQGGAVYNLGSVAMSNGSVTGNIASEKGGAIFAAGSSEDHSFIMTGGSIKDGNKSPEGAVSTAENSRLVFSGNAIVTGNTGMDGATTMNVYLGYDSNEIIRTPGLGSRADIGVYVADGEPEDPESRPDAVDNPIYADHGVGGRYFGTYTGDSIDSARLNKFTNDRDTVLKGRNGGPTGSGDNYFVAWQGKGLELKVTQYLIKTDEEGNPVLDENGNPVFTDEEVPVQNASFTFTTNNEGAPAEQVWSGKSDKNGIVSIPWNGDETPGGNAASFVPGSAYRLDQTEAADGKTVLPAGHWTVTIARDNAVTWTVVPSAEDSVDRTLKIIPPSSPDKKSYLGETFGLKNDIKPTITFDPNGGRRAGTEATEPWIDIVNFTTTEIQHTYRIEETDPSAPSRVFKTWATMETKPKGQEDRELTEEELKEAGYFEYGRDDEITFYRGTDSQKPDKKYAENESKGDMTLYAHWNLVVCKITTPNDDLLYVNGAPAVYGTLEEGFEALNNAMLTDINGIDYSKKSVRLQMLVPAYTLKEGVENAKQGTVELRTAAPEGFPGYHNDGYPYYDPDNPNPTEQPICTIYRGEELTNSMITNRRNLMMRYITLDGDNREVVCDGGIVNNLTNSSVFTLGSHATLRNSYVEGNGGAVNNRGNKSSFTLNSGGTIINCGATGSGGAIFAGEKSTVTVKNGSMISDNGASYGGAIYVDTNAAATISGGTITGNRATYAGAGIYLPVSGTLKLSGKPNFGGKGVYNNGNIDPTVGNFTAITLPTDAKNGGKAYTKARQDIYIEGTDNPHAAINVTGSLTSGDGTIWVWADNQNHYEMLKQFAIFSGNGTNLSNDAKETTMKAFRNAQPDSRTNCGGDYLTGQKGEVANWIYWTGGFDVVFKKIDGYGKPLPGATFTLYSDPACTTPFEMTFTGSTPATGDGKRATTVSSDGTATYKDKNGSIVTLEKGEVLLSKVPPKTFYLKETVAPTKDPEGKDHIYKLDETIYEVKISGTGELEMHKKSSSTATSYDVEVFKVKTSTNLDPVVWQYQVMNVSEAERKVIFRKVADGNYTAISGKEFKIYSFDGTEKASGTSLSSGVFWIGKLPFGTYYLHETSPDEWFTLTVGKDKVDGSRDGVSITTLSQAPAWYKTSTQAQQ